jgi:hypothetical protein
MNPSYTTNLMSSFYLWLDHELANIGQGFTVTSGQLYPIVDDSYANYNVYSSPFRQWVSDSSIPNAVVPSGVYCDGQFITRGSGVLFNFNKGEVLFPLAIKPKLATAQYCKKDFNIYYTDEREENLLFENAHALQSKFRNITGGLGGDDQPFPCIFIKNTSYQNIPYSFGGQEQTKTTIRCIILSDNMYLLDGAIAVMTDTVRNVFPLVGAAQLPYTYYGDFKSGTQYQYPQLASQASVNTTNLIYIDRVTVSRLDEIRNKHINLKVVAAMVDFDLWQARYPRIYNPVSV